MKTGSVGVVIGTTEGPSVVLRIAVEAPEIHSVVCLGMSTEALPISPAYDAFVRRPTGVVERELGHASYRADVSARIDNGNSWQLGLYLAHRLMAEGRLAAPDEAPEQWIWVTGTLDTDLRVGAVAETERKLERSEPWFAERAEAGSRVAVIVPEQSSEAVAGLQPEINILIGSGVGPVLDYLGLEAYGAGHSSLADSANQADSSNKPRAASPTNSWVGGSLVVLLLAIAVSAAVWLIQPEIVERAVNLPRGVSPSADVEQASKPESLQTRVVPAEIAPVVEAPTADTKPTPAPIKASTVQDASSVKITWSLGRAVSGDRCDGGITFSPFNASAGQEDGTVCRVAAEVTNQSNSRASVQAVAGILGRLREYTRADRYVTQQRRVLDPGAAIRLTLDVPTWIRGQIRVKMVVRIGDANAATSASLNAKEALELIGSSAGGKGFTSSTITLK